MRYFFTQTWCLKHQPDEKHQSQANYKRQDKHQNQTVSLGSLVLCTIMLFARPRFNLQPYIFKEAYFIFLEINMDRVEKTTEGPLPTNWTRVPCRPPWGLFFHIAQEGVLSDEHFTNGGTWLKMKKSLYPDHKGVGVNPYGLPDHKCVFFLTGFLYWRNKKKEVCFFKLNSLTLIMVKLLFPLMSKIHAKCNIFLF